VLICPALLSSCNKEIPEYYIRQELKDYGMFLNGSYWIYRNDSTGETDSVYVTNQPRSFMSGGADLRRLQEVINVRLNSKFLYQYSLGFQCNSNSNPNGKGQTDKLTLDIDESQPVIFNVLGLWPDQPSNLDQPSPCHCYPGSCLYCKTELIPEYSLGSNLFKNVVRTTYRTSDTSMQNPDAFVFDFYLMKHIGVIRMREKNNLFNIQRSYSLQKWEIKQ